MSKKSLIAGYLVLLFLLHQDWWLKDNAMLVFGFLPASLAYHMVFTIAAALGWLMVVKFAWPDRLEEGAENPDSLANEEGSES